VNFPSNSDNDLTQWNNQFADYVKTFMFFTYLADHFGGADMIRAVVQEPLNSISGVGMALANNGYQIPVQAVFVSWTIANYYHGWSSGLDDLDSLYLYFSIDPPPFGRSEYVSSFPSGPNSRNVNNWAADYIVFAEQDWQSYPLSIQFEGSQTGDFCLALLYYCNGNSYCTIADCPPDNTWDYQANFEYDDVAFMVCAPSDGSHNYTWSADLITGVDEKIEMPDKFSLESVSPNPFNSSTQIRFAIPSGCYAKLEIYDVGGRLVRRWLLDEAQDQGEIMWDGTDSEGREVATGMYLFKLSDNDNVQVLKGTLLK